MAVTVSHGGQSVSAADTRGLFLKVFSGEVLNAYERAVKISPLLTNRTITSGKSAQFPTTGLAVARYHQPGESLLAVGSDQSADSNAYLSSIKQSERIIYIDNLLTASCFIDQLDEAMTHYEYRTAFSTELGRALARHQDNYALHMLSASALDQGTVSNEHTPGAAHTALDPLNFYSAPGTAVDAIYDAAKLLDEANIPKDDRVVLMPPIAYYNLLKAGVLSVELHANVDSRKTITGGSPGVNDARGEGSGTRVCGMPVIVTNADGFTTSDATASANAGAIGDTLGEGVAYPVPTGDAEDAGMRNLAATGGVPAGTDGGSVAVHDTRAACFVFHKGCAGVLKLKDVTMESDYMVERQGTLMVAKMAQGMGALRNDAIVMIKTRDS